MRISPSSLPTARTWKLTDELRRLVTPEVYARVRVVNQTRAPHPDLVYLGDTPHGTPVRINRDALADIVIRLGACTHHVMGGFGGGRKSILPGISGLDTIRHNHAFFTGRGGAALKPRDRQRRARRQPIA